MSQKSKIIDVVCSWLSLALPILTPIKDTIEAGRSLADQLLSEKIVYVLENQDSDFDEWLKMSEKFDENKEDYEKTVRQLIYHINAINEVDILSSYANLLRAYKSGGINKNDFFRLAFCLTKLLSEDARYLAANIHRDEIEESIFCLSLNSLNLMYNKSRGFRSGVENEQKEIYCFTSMGKMLDKYALNYGNEERYSYKEKDPELVTQTLEYDRLEPIDVNALKWEEIE